MKRCNGKPVSIASGSRTPAPSEEDLILTILVQVLAQELVSSMDKGPFLGFHPMKYPTTSGYRRWFRKRFPQALTWTPEDRLDDSGLILPG